MFLRFYESINNSSDHCVLLFHITDKGTGSATLAVLNRYRCHSEGIIIRVGAGHFHFQYVIPIFGLVDVGFSPGTPGFSPPPPPPPPPVS